jgi:2-polyprenyl-3-methyl-5-hydroxy-6-metoxy-1,4-benzoquinol methylase
MIQFNINSSEVEILNSCPACGSANFTVLSEVSLPNENAFLSTALCDHCNHVFRNTRPSEEWFFRAFDDRHAQQQQAGVSPINQEVEADRYKRYAAIGEFFKVNFPEVKSVLDVGCGPGTGLIALNDLGFNCTGIDADESRASYAVEKGLKIFIGAWKDYHTEEGFDVVSCIHSLEHFYEPEKFLSEISQRVKDNGYLYIEVPDTLDHVKDWNDSLYLAHLSNFNQFSLALLAQNCGWEAVGRINPYRDTGLHEGHLVMVFKKSHGAKTNKVNEFAVDHDYATRVKTVYNKGYNQPYPHHFTVSAINDLSLTYKRSQEILRSVDENYIQRELRTVDQRTEVF